MKFKYQRLLVKTSIFYLILGVLLGIFIQLGYRYSAFKWALFWRTTHVHLLLVGFVLQMIMGVAIWMFPRRKELPYWTPELQGMVLYFLLNTGTITRTVGEPFRNKWVWAYWLWMIGSMAQVLSIFYFIALVYPRIRKPGS